MIVAPLLLSCCFAFAGAQLARRQDSDSWTTTFPDLNPRISERDFKENKEYRYLYDGQILTGLPETASQFSGLRIRAICTVQLRSGVDVLKCEKATLGRMNERSVDGPLDLQPAADFEELTGEEAQEWNTALTKPLRFQYDDSTGAVTDLESLETDPFWSVNIKRSILATFNLKLQKSQDDDLSHPRFTGLARQQQERKADSDDTKYFSVMEEGIGGECEAVYIVQSVSGRDARDDRRWAAATQSRVESAEALNVTKSWNYDNCKSRPIHLEQLNNGVKCVGKTASREGCSAESAKKENIIDSASHTKYTLTGNSKEYMIEHAETEAVHKFAPYSDKAGSMTAYVKATLRLIYAGDWSQGDMLPTEKGWALRGLRQWFGQDDDDEEREPLRGAAERLNKKFWQSRSGGEQWPNVSAKKTIVKALLERVVEDLADSEVQPESAHLVDQMVQILAFAAPEEIAEIHREVKGMARQSVDQEQVENVWFDILAACGTKPAVLYIKKEIVERNLDGERAAQVLNTLAFSIRRPDQDMVAEFLSLCKEPTVAAHSGMKKACWLSLGTLAHSSCVDDEETITEMQNTPAKNGDPKCTAQTRQRLVVELLARMKTSRDEEDKILILKTLGNTGFVEATRDLKELIKDDDKSTILRINAVYALLRIARNYPELVLSVVLPEYHDKTNPFQLRIAAFDVVIEAKADLPVLETIARSLQEEKSMQVGSYVYSKLNSLANATHPCFDDLNKDASLALEFAEPFQTGFSYSKGFHIDGYSEDLEAGAFAQINTIADPSSVIPRGANVRLNVHALGLSHDIIEAGVDTTGINALIRKFAMSRKQDKDSFADFFNDYDDDEILTSDPRMSSRSTERRSAKKFQNRPEFDEFDRDIGLTDREDEEITGSAYLKIFGHEVRFMTLTPKAVLKSIAESYLKPSERAGLARGSLPVDHRKALMAADAKMSIPTEIGLPLTVALKAPVVISVTGTVGLKTQPELSQATMGRLPHAFTVESDLKVSAATEVVSSISVWAAYLSVGAGIRAQVSTVIPLFGDLSIDMKTGKIETTMNIPQEPLELLNIEVLPATYTRRTPKTLVPHQPDRKDIRDDDRSEKLVQYNRQPLENEIPTQFFSYKIDLMENPTMLSKNGRPSNQFYEGLPMPVFETKEISTFDLLKTKLVRATIGHPALGFTVEVEGQVQVAHGVPHAPLLPIAGKDKIIITLRPSRAGLKSISAAVHLRKEHSAASAQPTWKNLFDKMVDYKTSGLLERLTSDLPAQFAKDDKSGFSAQVIVQGTGSRQEVAMQGVFSWIRGMDGKFVKVAAELSSPHADMPFQVCVNGHASYPEEYDSWNLTPATNTPVSGKWEVAAGRSCNAQDAAKVKVSFQADKSPEQLSDEKNDVYSIRGGPIPEISAKTIEPTAQILKPIWRECNADRKQGARWSPACEKLKELYSQLMQIKIDIDYQNIPRGIKVFLDQAEQLTHAMFQWNSEVDNVDVENQPNHVTILANFADDADLVDIVYGTPKKNAKLIGVPVPFPFGPVSADDEPLDMWETLLKEDLDDVCAVSGNRVNTLDNAKYSVAPSTCWTLLAKDCSEQEQWSVMYAKAGSRDSEGKKVVVYIGETKIEMKPASAVTSGRLLRSASDVAVRVNGRQIDIREDKQQVASDEDIEISIETDGDASAPYVAISAEEYGLELWFDGHNVAVKPTFWLRNQVCGLCGNNNGEEWDDMLLPNGKMADRVEDLFNGYTAQKDDCKTDEYTSQQLRSAPRYPFPMNPQDPECGKQKTFVKSKPGKVCFSVDPVESCPAGCRRGAQDDQEDSEYQLVRRAGFHCLPESSSLAQRLLSEVDRRVLTEISMKPVTDYFVVPRESCSARGGSNNNKARF